MNIYCYLQGNILVLFILEQSAWETGFYPWILHEINATADWHFLMYTGHNTSFEAMHVFYLFIFFWEGGTAIQFNGSLHGNKKNKYINIEVKSIYLYTLPWLRVTRISDINWWSPKWSHQLVCFCCDFAHSWSPIIYQRKSTEN